jgi:hypothetical protein
VACIYILQVSIIAALIAQEIICNMELTLCSDADLCTYLSCFAAETDLGWELQLCKQRLIISIKLKEYSLFPYFSSSLY